MRSARLKTRLKVWRKLSYHQRLPLSFTARDTCGPSALYLKQKTAYLSDWNAANDGKTRNQSIVQIARHFTRLPYQSPKVPPARRSGGRVAGRPGCQTSRLPGFQAAWHQLAHPSRHDSPCKDQNGTSKGAVCKQVKG